MGKLLGYVLSGSTSQRAKFQPRGDAEELIREGMLVTILDGNRKILSMISRIESYHEFYEPGEVWSEALRQGRLPPDSVARKYMVAHVILQGVLYGQGLRSVDKPPRPGSKVYEALAEDIGKLYGYKPNRESVPPNIVQIGNLYGYHRDEPGLPAVLDINKVTMHLAVLGVTGSGKSNTVGIMIEKLGAKDSVSAGGLSARTIPVVVFDANGDYLDYFYNPDLVPSYSEVVRLVFPSFAYSEQRGYRFSLVPLRIDLNIYHDRYMELSEIIYALTRGGRLDGVELQLDLLTRFLQDIASNNRIRNLCPYPPREEVADLNCVFSDDKAFERVLERLGTLADEIGAHKATVAAVKRTITSFVNQLNKNGVIPADYKEATVHDDFVDYVTDKERPRLVIVDFSTEGAAGVDLRIKQFIVSYMLSLFFMKFIYYRVKNIDRVCLVAVEEAQNYAPNMQTYPLGYSVARNILAMVATQGRKFGLSLALITQRPGFVDPVVMSMMNTFIIHRVSPGDIRFVELATGGLPSHMRARLPTLETGLAIIVGQMNVFPYPIVAKIYRRKSHRAGQVGAQNEY